MLSSFKLNDKTIKAAFERGTARHYKLLEQAEKEKPKTSAFSEEDFARFAAEYHPEDNNL